MVESKPQEIIILGAGIAGLRVAQKLQRKVSQKEARITLIDKSNLHVFKADLYEVATAFNEHISAKCLTGLQETVATPIKNLVDKSKVNFICSEVVDINPEEKKIMLKNGTELRYDYLVVALGSTTNYFNIPGLKEHSLKLKTTRDALKINCHLDQYFRELWEKKESKEIYVNVGGGGATGVEVAAELIGAVKRLSKKYQYDEKKIHIQLIEGSSTLVGLNEKGVKIVKERLESLGVKVLMGSLITEVQVNSITLKLPDQSSNQINSNILIWTGGVKINPVVQQFLGDPEKRGALEVNNHLQSTKYPEIFAAGDNAWIEDPKNPGRPLPWLGQLAFEQGHFLAKNLTRLVKGKPLRAYNPATALLVLPIGGRFGIFKIKETIFKGAWCWYLRRLVSLKYALAILPFFKALKKWHHGNNIFVDND